jgi:hypothetical protein
MRKKLSKVYIKERKQTEEESEEFSCKKSTQKKKRLESGVVAFTRNLSIWEAVAGLCQANVSGTLFLGRGREKEKDFGVVMF